MPDVTTCFTSSGSQHNRRPQGVAVVHGLEAFSVVLQTPHAWTRTTTSWLAGSGITISATWTAAFFGRAMTPLTLCFRSYSKTQPSQAEIEQNWQGNLICRDLRRSRRSRLKVGDTYLMAAAKSPDIADNCGAQLDQS